MPPNKPVRPEVLAEIRRLKAEMNEPECRKRAERMARRQSPEGRAGMVRRLRKSRSLPTD